MKPINFKGANVVFGKNQESYNPLPALKLHDGEVYTCWELSDEEIEDIKKNKRIYISQFTFNKTLQPLLPMVKLGDNIELT